MDKNTADRIKQAELAKRVQENNHAAVSDHSSTESAVSEPEFTENNLSAADNSSKADETQEIAEKEAVNTAVEHNSKKEDKPEKADKSSEKKKADANSADDKKKKLKQHIQQTVYLQRNSGSAKISAAKKQEQATQQHGIVGTAITTGVKVATDTALVYEAVKKIEKVKDISDAYDYTRDQAVKLVVNSLKAKIAKSTDQVKARKELKQELNEMKSKGMDDAAKEYKDLMAKISSTAYSTEEMSKLNALVQKGVPDYIALEQTVKELDLKAVGLYAVGKPVKAAISAGEKVATVVNTVEESSDTGEAAANLVLLPVQKVAETAAKGTVNAIVKASDFGEKKVKEAAEKIKEAASEKANETANELKEKAKQAAEKRKYQAAQQAAKKEKAKEVYKNYQKARAAQNTATAAQAAKAFIAEKGGGAAVAAGGGIAVIVVLAIIVVLLIIAALFSWLDQHPENLYNDTSKTYENLVLKEEEDILKGYINHIQDWFDRKQIEILQVTDLKYGGFDPDDYEYKDKISQEKTRIEYQYGVDVVLTRKLKFTVITGQFTKVYNYVEQTDTDTSSTVAFYKVYYKYKDDSKQGLLEYCEPTDSYDYCDIIIAKSVDLNGFYQTAEYQTLHNQHPSQYPIYTYDNGSFIEGESIADITVKRSDGTEKPLTEWLLDTSDPAIKALYTGEFRDYKDIPYDKSKSNLPGDNGITEGDPVLLEENLSQAAFTDRPHALSAQSTIGSAQGIFDPNIWNLNEVKNEEKWIKLPDEIDFEGIIALAALRKWQEIEVAGSSLPPDHAYHITEDDLDYVLNSIYVFEYHYDYGACKDEDCCYMMQGDTRVYYCGHKPGHIHANKAPECKQKIPGQAHKKLTGKVINNGLIGGINYIMNKVLDSSSPNFEQDKEIYGIYKAYINEKLGTSTKLDDYENDKNAQQRLYRKFLLMNGIGVPSSPRNVKVGNITPDFTNSYCSEEDPNAEPGKSYSAHVPLMLKVSWEPPELAEETGVLGYHVYLYSMNGSCKYLGTTTETSMNVCLTKPIVPRTDTWYGGYGAKNVKKDGAKIDITKTDSGAYEYQCSVFQLVDEGSVTIKRFILVTAYNEFGDSLLNKKELAEMPAISYGKITKLVAGHPFTMKPIELYTYPAQAKQYLGVANASAGMKITLSNGRVITVESPPDE